MVTLNIQGMQDGVHALDVVADVSDVPNLPLEFVGPIEIHGNVSKLGRRLHIDVELLSIVRLICDRSLEEYDEQITVDVSLDVIVDTEQAIRQGQFGIEDEVIAIREDDRLVDISDVVRQELIVHLPMRRVAPAYREVDLGQVFPHMADRDADVQKDSEVIDERWAALRSLRKP